MQDFPGWTVSFEPLFRQEQSHHASGRVRVKDFGTPIWQATYQSRQMRPNELDQWRARLARLGNGLETFKAWPTSRCWPILHPNGQTQSFPNWVLNTGFWRDSGVWLTGAPWNTGAISNGTVATIGANRKTLTIAWTGNTTVLSVGDYIEINGRWLHQIVDRQPGGINEVVPHLSVGALVGQTVNIHKPGVNMTIVPGSVNTQTGLNGRGTVSFRAIEARG